MKKALLLTVGLMTLSAFAAVAQNGPLHVLYLGKSDVGGGRGGGGGGGGGRFGGPFTNYSYLPGQTLAPEAIYFDHVADLANLTDKYLSHFDLVVQAVPDTGVSPSEKSLLAGFEKSGKTIVKYPDGNRPAESVLREAVLGAVSSKAKSGWEAFLAARPPLERMPGDVPNYERRPEPVKFQKPLSAGDSMKYVQVPADFDLQLFASEPDVVKPIAMAWDERGRAWVVEARDYPHGLVPDAQPGLDTIKICEDTDGDGKADKFTIFADKLNMATALVFVNGGVIVSEARHMTFLKDTNGDDKADVRQVLLPGWGTSDTHAMESNLGRGFDNWLYGAVGYSAFNGTVGGKALQFAQGVYRFKANGSALEFLYQFNNNTWGFAQNAYGDVFGSTANGNPSFYGYLPATIVEPTQAGSGRGRNRGGRNGAGNAGATNAAAGTNAEVQIRRLQSAYSMAAGMRMHPNTPNVREVDSMGGYTAAAGHSFMVSDALPARLQGKALVNEPTCKIVGIMDIQRDGGGYKALDGHNLLASTDEWMSPIFSTVGPDGAVWVIDFYSFIIQHNPTPNPNSAGIQARTGPGGAYMTEPNLRDQTHGRIYRVVWKDGPKTPIKTLAGAKTPEIVAALDSGNQQWSLTAQRLIVDNKKTDAATDLKKRVRSGTGGTGAIHALWALEGIGALDKDTHQAALLDKDPAVRRNAVRALPSTTAGRQLFFSSAVIQDPDLITRQAAFVKLAQFPTIPEIQTVVAQLGRAAVNTNDAYLNDSLTLLGRIHKVTGVGMNEVKVTAGDPKRGSELFFTSPTAACASCHTVGSKGGDVGPILDGIAVRATKDYILESLMEPNAKLAKGYESLTMSPMPPLGMLLKEQELADILAFLQTLKTPPKDGNTVPAKKPNIYD